MARILIPGPSGGAIVKKAAQALGGGRVVRIVNDTDVDYCDAYTLAHLNGLLGVTLGAVGAGDDVTIITLGEVPGLSGLTAGDPVYCGANGVLTQTFDPAFEFTRIVGYASGATLLYVALREPVVLL